MIRDEDLAAAWGELFFYLLLMSLIIQQGGGENK